MAIAIVSYGMGNIQSVYNALEFLGHTPVVASQPGELAATDKIIIPGVGAFPKAMERLRESGFVDSLNEIVLVNHKPVLGICLGMQLLAETGTEVEECDGLGWIPGRVIVIERTEHNLRVPHVGWNDLKILKDCPLLVGLEQEDATCYFVHSLYLEATRVEDISAVTEYGRQLTACVSHGHIFGTQFHPEKSQITGLKILENFARL